jgi:hypothetical protein
MSGFITGSVINAYSSRKASKEQSRATDRASEAQLEATKKSIASQERMFERQVALQEPFRKVGVNALPELVEASRYTPFSMEQFQQDPGYGFRLKEGLRALESSAAARGGLLSGNQMRGVTRYGQELGSQEYTNAFNRYQLERQARLNPLQSLAGMGQSTAATLGGQAGQFGSGMAQTYNQMGQNMAQNAMTQGNIRASGYMNTANALTGGLNQYLNYQQNQRMMDRFFPPQQPSVPV